MCWTAFALLPGCQPAGPESLLERYLQELSIAFAMDYIPPGSARLAVLPGTNDLQLTTSTGETANIDIVALSGCAVQATVIKRNSTLGRGATPTQRLLLELEYLRLAPPCIRHLRDRANNRLAAALDRAWQLGLQQLPALIFNATLGSAAFESFWTPTPAPGAYPRVEYAVAVAALATINTRVEQWLAGNYEADNLALELRVGEVAGGGGGALLLDLARQQAWLAAANDLLQQVLVSPVCAAPDEPTGGRSLASVRQYFETRLRPGVTDAGDRYRVMHTGIKQLELQLVSALPQRYNDWRRDRDTLFSQLERAPRQHAALLRELSQRCHAP